MAVFVELPKPKEDPPVPKPVDDVVAAVDPNVEAPKPVAPGMYGQLINVIII